MIREPTTMRSRIYKNKREQASGYGIRYHFSWFHFFFFCFAFALSSSSSSSAARFLFHCLFIVSGSRHSRYRSETSKYVCCVHEIRRYAVTSTNAKWDRLLKIWWCVCVCVWVWPWVGDEHGTLCVPNTVQTANGFVVVVCAFIRQLKPCAHHNISGRFDVTGNDFFFFLVLSSFAFNFPDRYSIYRTVELSKQAISPPVVYINVNAERHQHTACIITNIKWFSLFFGNEISLRRLQNRTNARLYRVHPHTYPSRTSLCHSCMLAQRIVA